MRQSIVTVFIKFTDPDKVADQSVWINPSQITCFETLSRKGKEPKTVIRLTNRDQYAVKETPEQILEKIAKRYGVYYEPFGEGAQ